MEYLLLSYTTFQAANDRSHVDIVVFCVFDWQHLVRHIPFLLSSTALNTRQLSWLCLACVEIIWIFPYIPFRIMNSYIPYGERKMASTEPTSIRDDSNSQSEHDSIESDSYIDQTVREPILPIGFDTK